MKFSGPVKTGRVDPVKKKTTFYCINTRSAGRLQKVTRENENQANIIVFVVAISTAVVEGSNQVSIVSPIGINHDVLSILYDCIFLRNLSFAFFISDQMLMQVSGCIL